MCDVYVHVWRATPTAPWAAGTSALLPVNSDLLQRAPDVKNAARTANPRDLKHSVGVCLCMPVWVYGWQWQQRHHMFLNSHRGTTAWESGTEVAVRQDCTTSPSKMSGCCFFVFFFFFICLLLQFLFQ